MRAPEETIEYGYISEQKPKCTVWTKSFDEAVEMAKADQPKYRPWYILEKTEHFKICGVVDNEEHGDLTSRQAAIKCLMTNMSWYSDDGKGEEE